jgi:MFS transporter, DHA1 family, tetracycline resistance protein
VSPTLPDVRTRPQIPLVLAAVFVVYVGQMALNPVIAPLSREFGMPEWQLGVVISVAAVMLVLFSGFWGRRSQSWGRKPVLLTAMSIATAAITLFTVLAWIGTTSAVDPTLLFWAMLVTRGVLFGSAIAAMVPTAQAYVANVTESEEARVKGMAGVGAVQGLAMIGGAVLGGVLSSISLLTAVTAVPVILAIGVVLVATTLRPEPRTELIATPARVRVLDRRVWPFLLAGFGLFSALGFIQVVSGFLVQDRLGLSATMTGLVNGIALLLAGVGMALAQAVLVPRLGKGPGWLLPVGAAVALAGFLLLLLDLGVVPFLAGMLLAGLGIGLAMPGFSAGPSLLLRPEEQGGIAGLVGATSGLTFVVAPTLSTVLYGVWPQLPVLVGVGLLALVVLFTALNPVIRAAGRR